MTGVAPVAARLGIRGAACLPLAQRRETAGWAVLGSLQMYADRPDAFDADARQFGQVLAAAAVGVAYSRAALDLREAALHRSLSTRDLIGQARGILMERERLSAGDAFDLLRHVSQRLNRKVVDVAGYLTDTGQLPR